MILEEGKEYTRDEIMEFMGISLEVWNHNKNKLLDNLANYYEFEINYNDSKQNIKWTYRIVKKLGEYYPIERKTKKRKEFETLLEKTIKEIVAEDDLQSAANITRLISKFEDCHKDKFAAFGYSEGYLYELVRIKLKEMYGEYKISFGKVGYIEDRVSCVANVDDCIYTPLNEKERKFLYDAYSKRRNENTEQIVDLMLDYDSGFIDKKTLKDTTCEFNIGAWIAARQDFKAEFGYYPLKINKYKSELPLIWEE